MDHPDMTLELAEILSTKLIQLEYGRERVDREACTSPVRIPWVCCDQHEPDDPIV